MIYDGFMLSAVISELKKLLLRGQIQKIKQLNDNDIVFSVYNMGKTFMLFISVDARYPRVHITASSPQAPKTPPHFCMVARKHLEGSFIEDIAQTGLERILTLTISNPSQKGMKLIFELMGRHSNLIITNSTDKILGAIKNVGSSVSKQRQIVAGRQYSLPPVPIKIHPADLTKDKFEEIFEANDDFQKMLVSNIGGISPYLAEEIILRANNDKDNIYEEIKTIGKIVANAQYMPVFITDDKGKNIAVYPMPLVKYSPENQHIRTSINNALDAFFRTFIKEYELEETRNLLLAAISRSITAKNNLIRSFERTIDESNRAETYKIKAEMLQAGIAKVKKGDVSVMVENYYDPSLSLIEIELDPKLDPKQNIQKYFKRYQKAKDSKTTATTRLETTKHQLQILKDAKEKAKQIGSVHDLRALQSLLSNQNLLRQEKTKQQQDKDEFAGHKIRRIFTKEGWEILYGENATSNDYLTQKIARPNDMWLHARQITGSHVIIKAQGKNTEIPHGIILQAAMIAASNCEAKHSSLIPIDYTFRKFVRKPRGAISGFVTYRNEKTIDITPKNNERSYYEH